YIGLDKEIAKVGESSGNDEEGNGSDENVGADGTITLPNNDVVTCTFDSNEDGYYATDTDHFVFGASDTNIDASTDSDGNLNYGSVTIGDTEYTVYYKLTSVASGGGITFTTLEDNTELTLVCGPTDTYDGSKYVYISPATDKQYITSQVFTYNCETAGTYTITQGSGQYHIFYIGLNKQIDTGINNITWQATGNDKFYNLNGQRVTNPRNGVFILNGKKVLIK
ncbi:MAG: hypothetical protein LUC88_05660, partial [Prevotella sp.]|nr:hypothetical protein [Prevotella sp.]